jgi:hypothetical protein
MTPCIEAAGSTRYRYRLYAGKVRLAHRVAYVLANGLTFDDIEGLVVRHKCDNPACVNPLHLELGTQQDNIDDKVVRDRQAKGSGHGMAELTEDAVRFIKSNYKRRCKEFGGRALAARFGVHESTVSDIMLGYTWGHV